MTSHARPPIAVVGVSALFPGSQDAAGFWSDIVRGADLLGDVPPTHWLIEDYYDPDPKAPDKTYARRGGFLQHVDFDPIAWGVPPKILRATDTTQLLALVVAEAVLRDAAGGRFESMDRSQVSVILGVTSAQELISTMTSRLQRPVWTKALREHGVPEHEVTAICDRIADHYVPWEESSFPGLLGNVVAGRIANRLDLGGTNCVTDAACASTFAALNMAMQELYLGDSKLVITGGADTLNDIFMFMCFSKTPALSMSGDCRPFSDQADGTMLGEGLGMVALKRLEDAERDGDQVYAVIRGIGSSSDGRSKSVYAPVSEGQAVALRRAREHAGVSARTIELIEAHGTGTKAGDAAEFDGLRLAFEQEGSTSKQWCAIGSVKSQIGHTKAAAGAAGLFKAVMAVHHKVLPPTIKVDRPNPKLQIEDSPFYLNTTARPWIRPSDHPRRAGVSAFGFGGSNFHVIVEEYVGAGKRAKRLRAGGAELVVLSGRSGADVAKQARAWAGRADEQGILEWAAWSSQASFDATAPVRLAVVVESSEQLRSKLERAAARIEGQPDASFESPDGTAYGVGTRRGEVAFLFPGQGSQYVGMTRDVALRFEVARAAWDRAAELELGEGARLDRKVFPIPRFDDAEREADEVALRATQWAQPAIGCASLSLLALLRELGIEASAVAGHSFGEVTALHAAGVIAEADVLRVARRRGELMAEAGQAGPRGSMSAVVGSVAQVEAALAGIEGVVLANLNSPTQTVISGTTEAIEQAEAALARAGLEVRRLPVASAFHSPVVSASAEPFAAFLREIEFGAARLPVYSGESGAPYERDAELQRTRLGRQIAEPVRFTDVITAMADAGIHTFIEVGPGAVLTNLVGQILGDRSHAAVALDRRGSEGLTSLVRALARLAALGVPMRLQALWDGYREPVDPSAEIKPKLVVPLCGSNHEKPYPPPGGAAALPPPNPPRPAASERLEAVAVMPDRPASVPGSELQPRVVQPQSVQPQAVQPVVHASAPSVGDGWLAAWQEAQRQTAQTHALVQQAMASSHAAYLKATETALTGLAAMAGVSLPSQVQAQPFVPAPMPVPVIEPQPVVSAPVPAPVIEVPRPVPAPVVAPRPEPAPIVAAASSVAAAPKVDLEALMLAVVAEKTGYPESMLELSMDMEAELGIDSIKRVEILAAVQERAPGLLEIDAGHMGTLRTLGEIVAYMQSLLGAAPVAVASVATRSSAAVAPSVDLAALMLKVVAEKTGYPESMLELSMDMEAELGIDSIKRVEILAAVQEQAPGLPEIDAGHMGTLRTLGDIVAYMQSLLGPSTATVVRSTPAVAIYAAAPSVNLEALMLAVVAEKTGYPESMLELSMDMEAELGIDSIKRVEILAAVQEQAPGLPEIDAGHMGTLRTLGEIVTYMQRLMTGGAASSSTSAAAVEVTSTAAANLGRYALELCPAPQVGLAQAGLHAEGGVVICGHEAIGTALVTELRARGLEARVVQEVPADAGAVVLLAGLRDVASDDEALAINREAFRAARAVAARMSERGGLFVSVQDTGGGFGLEACPPTRAWLAGLPALIKTAKQEWPEAGLKAIDLDRAGRSAEQLARTIADELLLGGGELEVALAADGPSGDPQGRRRAGSPNIAEQFWGVCAGPEVPNHWAVRRRTLRSFESTLEPSAHAPTIGRGDVVVVSGGARGVTAACVIEWAKQSKARFVLLGRSALEPEPSCCAGLSDDASLKRALLADAQARNERLSPAELSRRVAAVSSGREIRATLDAIARVGGEARYLSVDVTDARAVADALADVRREWGPIVGLVHGAGVLADKRIAELGDQAFEHVFATKIDGLRALLDATQGDALRVLCLFSSVSARCGNNGQAAYAMANEVLNKVAQAAARARPQTRVRALDWGPWEGGMVSPQLREHFARLGVPMIPLEVGAKMFAAELSGAADPDPTHVELVLGGEPRPEALLVKGSEARTLELEVHLDRRTHGYLADHSIAGTVVVPVVLAVEWFSRIARAFRPDLHLRAITDVRVLRGIKLHKFDDGGDRLRLRCKQLRTRSEITYSLGTALSHDGFVARQSSTPGTLPPRVAPSWRSSAPNEQVISERALGTGDGAILGLEILGTDGALHYRAEAKMATSPSVLGRDGDEAPRATMRAWGDAIVYGDVLFHGRDFQVIESLDGVADDGISGTLRGVHTAGWKWEPWQTDVAAHDGGLQMAVLWARERLGGATLPMSIGEVRIADAPLAEGPLRVVANCRKTSPSHAVVDVVLFDGAGTRVSELRNTELVLRPDQPRARA